MEEINEEAYLKLKKDLDSNESIMEFLVNKGYTPHETMECVLHKHGKLSLNGTSTPSLFINEKKGMFHCFSCGRGGKYTDFIYAYAVDVEGRNDGKMKGTEDKKAFLQQQLIKNKEWQKKYGIEDLKTTLVFSVETLKYLFNGEDSLRKARRKSVESDEEIDFSKGENYKLLKNFRKIKEPTMILDFLSKIQYGETDKE